MSSIPHLIAPAGTDLVCHRGPDAVAAATPAWEALLRLRPAAPVFVRPGWAQAWLLGHGRGHDPHVLEVRCGGRPVGLIALQLTTVAGSRLRRLEFLGGSPPTRRAWMLDPHGLGLAYYNDALIEPGAEELFLGELRGWLERNSDRWDDLRLTAVPEASPLARHFDDVVARGWHRRRSVDRRQRAADTSSGWEAYQQGLSRRTRRHLRYDHGALARAAGAELVLDEVRGDRAPAAMEEFIGQHDRRWAAERKPGLSGGEAALYRSLAALGDERFVIFRLVGGGRVLAAQFGFDHGGVYLAYNFTYDPDHGRHSPANVLLQMVIERCCDRGLSHVDLIGLRNAERWARIDRVRVQLEARRPGLMVAGRWAMHAATAAALANAQASLPGRRIRSGLAASVAAAKRATRRGGPLPRTLSPTGSPVPRVLLLTSHAVAPPWDGGDKNTARLLLEGAAGVEYAYVGSRDGGVPWPQPHIMSAIDFRHETPTARDKLQLFRWLIMHPPAVDTVHVLVTFQSRLIQHALLALPLLRSTPLVVTCLSRANLPWRLIYRSRAVVAISAHTERLLRDSGVANVHRIAPGVNLQSFHPDASLDMAPAGGGGAPRLLFAGHYDRGGGLDAALGFTARLRERLPSARLMVAMRLRRGETAAWAQAHLRRRSAVAGVGDAVDDLGTPADIRSAFRACSVVLFQPEVLGLKMELPMTLLEALAAGRPIVVSPVPPLTELADGSLAVTVAGAGDAAALDHVERLLTDPGLAAQSRRVARKLAEREFSSTRMVAGYRRLYQSLAKPHNGPAAASPL